VLAEAAPDIVAPVAVRRAGIDPVFSRVDPDDVTGATVRATLVEAAEVGSGKVAVVAPTALLGGLAGALGPDLARTGTDAAVLDAKIAVLAPEMVKGLEFDSVVVVEPARVVAESPQGLRALYVALTRTTRRLCVISSEPLPRSLAAPGGSTPTTEQPPPEQPPREKPPPEAPRPDDFALPGQGRLWPGD